MAPADLEAHHIDGNADRYGGSHSFVQEMQEVAGMTRPNPIGGGSSAGVARLPHVTPARHEITGGGLKHASLLPTQSGYARDGLRSLLAHRQSNSRDTWLKLRRRGLFGSGC